MKLKIAVAAAIIAMVSNGNAANYLISNVVAGDASDVLFQNADGSLMSGGIVALGYFSGTAPSSSIADIATTISNFTLITSAAVGGFSVDLDASIAGYVQADLFNGAQITTPSLLIGKAVYMFVGNASTLATSTAFALGSVATIADDVPFVQQYQANPGNAVILGDIGTTSTSGANATLKLVDAVPEPSAALLGAVGALGLLRRRRN